MCRLAVERWHLKRPFVSDTGEATACLFMSLRRQSLLSQYNKLTQKMVLERAFITVKRGSIFTFGQVSWETDFQISDTEEASVCSSSGLMGDRAHSVNTTSFLRRLYCKGH